MEAFLFLGLVPLGALFVAGVMWRLRFEGDPPPPPLSILAVLLAVVVAMLILSVAIASWLNVVSFAMLTIVYGALVFQALRARRST